MDFGDSKQQVVPRFGSPIFWDSPNQQPLGIASTALNVRYRAQSVATRWGFANRLKFGAQNSNISGIETIRYLSADNQGTEYVKLLAYTATDGNIWCADPFNQGSVAQLSTDALMALAYLPRYTGLNPRVMQSFNKGFIAQGDLTTGVGNPWVYDPANATLDPVSDKPFATPWTPNTRFRVGQMVSPSKLLTAGLANPEWTPIVTGHFYRVTVNGTTGVTQPTWPTSTGGVVVDGATFQEYTPNCGSGLPDPSAPITPTTTPDGGSPIIDQATVYVVLTYVSAQGESINDLTTSEGSLDTSKVLVYMNVTGSPIDLNFVLPPIPADVGTGGPLGANGATGYNTYAYIVQGDPDDSRTIDPTYYAQFGATNQPAGTGITLSGWPVGQSLPQVNTANISGAGNVDTGLRWMVVIYQTRTLYQTGYSKSAPIPVNVTNSGRNLLSQKIPIGPYNCVRRLCGFTVAGASSAGPYTYVDQDDVESPGFNQADIPITKTTIDDNVTTTATFNFTDSYLPGASDITDYLQRKEITKASDIYFAKTINSNVYCGVDGFPSGFLVSDYADPEAIRIPGSNLQVAETDGDRTVCWREVRENQIALKENSGHAVVPNDGDASTWAVNRIWGGSGPINPKACDVAVDERDEGKEFLVYVHRDGLYRWVGGQPHFISPELIGTPEIPGWWDRINWDYGYLIVVTVDELRREIRISVPFDGSTTRNKVITCCYYFGWEDPVIFSSRTNRMVPNLNGRKWSLDDVQANDMKFVPRRQNVSNASLFGIDLTEQFIKVSADGAVYTLRPGQYYDDDYNLQHGGYLSKWLSVPAPNVGLSETQLDGASCSAVGNGFCNVYAIDKKGSIYPLSKSTRTWTLSAVESARDFGVVGITSDSFGIGFDNGGVAGAWFEMHTANLWVLPTFQTRMG